MVLTAIEFLGLAFFLGMIAGAVLEQLARPRTKPNTTPTTPEPQPDWKKLSGSSLSGSCNRSQPLVSTWGHSEALPVIPPDTDDEIDTSKS